MGKELREIVAPEGKEYVKRSIIGQNLGELRICEYIIIVGRLSDN